MKEAIIFTRTAIINQNGDSSQLQEQKEKCLLYAKKKGITIKQYFGGLMASGKKDEKIELENMFQFIKQHPSISTILVSSMDRISRNWKTLNFVLEESQRNKISILSTNS